MPVLTQYTQHLQFGASHVLDKHRLCAKMHGHSYHVRLTFTGEPVRDNWGLPMTEENLDRACLLVGELRNRHLNDMIPAGAPTVTRIAQYLLERTRMLGVTRVEVHESDTDAEGSADALAG